MSAEGAVLFARYAYPPNELGYCGPTGSGVLLDAAATAAIEQHARGFEGAWVYLEAIAAATGYDDPLAAAVVEAYWVGNGLLDGLDPAVLHQRLVAAFGGQLGGTWREAADRALPHHSFQVFEVYPWLALLASATDPQARATATSVLDRCRIRTGVVLETDGDLARVESRPLVEHDGRLGEGPAQREDVRWRVDGAGLLPEPRPGDLVALHWDWLCDVVTPRQAKRITAYEHRVLANCDAAG